MEEHRNLFLIFWFVGLQAGNTDRLCLIQELFVLIIIYINASMRPMVSSTWRFGRQKRGGRRSSLRDFHTPNKTSAPQAI